MTLRRRFGAFTAATLLAAFALSPAVTLAAEPTDTNLALTSTVSASGTETDSQFTPDRAADGNVMPEGGTTPAVHNDSQASRWSAPKDDGPWWIQLEFPASAHLSRVSVHWGNTYATNYRLEVSDNGTDFTPIVENAAATAKGEVVNHDVDTTTRFLRLYATQKSAKWSMSLWELEAFGTLTTTPPAHDATSIIPKPYSAQITNDETFKLSATTCVSGNKSTMGAQQVLQNRLGIASGTDCAIKLAVNPQAELFDAYERQHLQANEGYQLTISSDEVTITGASPRAVVWGVQSLIQLAGPWASVQLAGTVDSTDSAATPAAATVAANATESTPTNITDYKAQTIELPTLQIKDAPRYKWRGLLLDPARSFIAVDDVLGFIDEMSALKLNTLHFHLSDDQGWRIAISQPEGSDIDYTKLTEISGATAFGASKWADVAGDTGYYTRDDFAKIVRYAASRGVSVVPEIDGPGHTQAALHAIDQLNTADAYPHPAEGETRVPADIGQGNMDSTLDPHSEATYEFLNHVYTDVIGQVRSAVASSLDPSLALNYFHLGGDESATTTGADYQEFMRRTTTMITDESLTPIVWNEAMKESFDTLPANTVVQYWNQAQVRFAEHAARGGSFIMSPASNTYFPQIPSTDVAGPNWACGGGACDLQRWYNWDPTQRAGVPEANVQGVEGAMWNEHMRGNHDGSDNMSFKIFPRIFALSEVGWTQQSERAFNDFTSRLAAAGTALNVRGRTFHLAQGVGFTSSYLPLTVHSNVPLGSDTAVHIGMLSLPGAENTQGLPSIGILRDAQGVEHKVSLSYSMPKTFHYTDEGRMTGRRMNSIIDVYAHIPASLSVPEGAATVRLSGTVAASGRRLPITFGENAVSTITFAEPKVTEEPSTPEDGNQEGTGEGGTETPGTGEGGSQPEQQQTIVLKRDKTVIATIKQGEQLTVHASGLPASNKTTISLHSDPVVLDTVQSDADGRIAANVTIPADTQTGSHEIVVESSNVILRANLQVTAATTDSGTQTDDKSKDDKGTQTDGTDTEDSGTQTDDKSTDDKGAQTDGSTSTEDDTQTAGTDTNVDTGDKESTEKPMSPNTSDTSQKNNKKTEKNAEEQEKNELAHTGTAVFTTLIILVASIAIACGIHITRHAQL